MKFIRSSSKENKKLIAVDLKQKKFEFPLPLSQEIMIDGKKHEIKIKEDEKLGIYILWKQKKYPVELLYKNQNRYEVLLNGVSYFFTIETPTSYKRLRYLSSKKGSSKNENLSAPMPGKIVDVLAEEGQEIRAGEPLLILEAMKMQNEIQSPSAGKIKKIHVKATQNVLKDDLLIEIQARK